MSAAQARRALRSSGRSITQTPPSVDLSLANNIPSPSAKALGKRRAPPPPENVPLPTPTPAPETARRVLPNRSSRRGPTGSSLVDGMILDAQQRAAANKPILPPNTIFLLTTDSSLAPMPQTNGPSETDRPKIQPPTKMQQQIIKTPDFESLPVASAVGSRLRARGTEEELADTSDEAYNARHRKFETLEKRQRLREKEKLQHERYKLKERIDQLRAMDGSAFLSSISNAGSSIADGERKRRELLKEAEELEKRYDTLLSERKDRGGGVGGVVEDAPATPLKLKFKFGPRSTPLSPSVPNAKHPTPSFFPSSSATTTTITTDSPKPLVRGPSGRFKSSTPQRQQNGQTQTQDIAYVDPGGGGSNSPPRPKRIRLSLKEPQPTTTTTISTLNTPDILRVAPPPNASRKTLRHASAFGVKIPSIIDEPAEFRLPRGWVRQFRGDMYAAEDGW